jgi:hypothetical protein
MLTVLFILSFLNLCSAQININPNCTNNIGQSITITSQITGLGIVDNFNYTGSSSLKNIIMPLPNCTNLYSK